MWILAVLLFLSMHLAIKYTELGFRTLGENDLMLALYSECIRKNHASYQIKLATKAVKQTTGVPSNQTN